MQGTYQNAKAETCSPLDAAQAWLHSRTLVAITDALGQVTTLGYLDSADPLRITKVTDPFGRAAVLTYDGAWS